MKSNSFWYVEQKGMESAQVTLAHTHTHTSPMFECERERVQSLKVSSQQTSIFIIFHELFGFKKSRKEHLLAQITQIVARTCTYIYNNASTTKLFYFIVATKMNFYSCNFIMKNISTHSAYIRKSRACSPIEWRRLFRMCGWLFYISYNMHT